MIWRILLSALLGFLVAAVIGATLYLASPEGRQLLDRVWINATRVEHRSLWQAGRQLPGTPDLAKLDARLAAKGLKLGDPIFIRVFKLESELELWMERDGTYVHFATYPICYWSGRLGPKRQEGDLQAPEGYYTVDASQLNPNSRWHRSFNLGFPNNFDKAQGRTGSYLMVHGGCASVGCYAMTNPVVDEIWRIVTAALEGGQPRFAVMALPFRMTKDNMSKRKGYPWRAFWTDLKTGNDLFEKTHVPPKASVCDGRYAFAPGEKGAPVPEVEEGCTGAQAKAKAASSAD
ncbi:MAG: L,D-transpeptidase family protein [Methyloligella sp. ZOD6]